MNKEPGYVYKLTNPFFREDWVKTGKKLTLPFAISQERSKFAYELLN